MNTNPIIWAFIWMWVGFLIGYVVASVRHVNSLRGYRDDDDD